MHWTQTTHNVAKRSHLTILKFPVIALQRVDSFFLLNAYTHMRLFKICTAGQSNVSKSKEVYIRAHLSILVFGGCTQKANPTTPDKTNFTNFPNGLRKPWLTTSRKRGSTKPIPH